MAETTERESNPGILVSAPEEALGVSGILLKEQYLLAVYTALLQLEPVTKKLVRSFMVRTSISIKECVENMFY